MDDVTFFQTKQIYQLLTEYHDITFSNFEDIRTTLRKLHEYGCVLSGLSEQVMDGEFIDDSLNGISLGESGNIYTIQGIYHGNPVRFDEIFDDDDCIFDVSEEEFLNDFYVLMQS